MRLWSEYRRTSGFQIKFGMTGGEDWVFFLVCPRTNQLPGTNGTNRRRRKTSNLQKISSVEFTDLKCHSIYLYYLNLFTIRYQDRGSAAFHPALSCEDNSLIISALLDTLAIFVFSWGSTL